MGIDVRNCRQCRDGFRPKKSRQRFCSVACAGLARRLQARDRFWRRVDKRGVAECWEWQGPRTDRGYGTASLDRRTWRAHRLAVVFSGRDLPDGLVVMHSCDNPPCCNPEHLIVGTFADNNADMMSKSRWSHPRGAAKLTPEDVMAIRASSDELAALSARFGVSKSTICRARNGKQWGHL